MKDTLKVLSSYPEIGMGTSFLSTLIGILDVLNPIITFISLSMIKRSKTDESNVTTINESMKYNYVSAASLFVTYILSYFAFNDSYDFTDSYYYTDSNDFTDFNEFTD